MGAECDTVRKIRGTPRQRWHEHPTYRPGLHSGGFLAIGLQPAIDQRHGLIDHVGLHAVLRRHAGRIFILIPAYATLLLGWPVLVVAACGMIDQWFGLRQRFAAAVSRQGE